MSAAPRSLREVERGRARLPQPPAPPPPPQTVAEAFKGFVWRSVRYFLYMLLGLLALVFAPNMLAQETTIEVPQGPVFPSIAQADCSWGQATSGLTPSSVLSTLRSTVYNGCSSVGRALPEEGRGRRFDACHPSHFRQLYLDTQGTE